MNSSAIEALKDAYSAALDNAYRYEKLGNGVLLAQVKRLADLRQALAEQGVNVQLPEWAKTHY